MNVAEIYEKGLTSFMGLELQVAPGALVPREETELLGRAAITAIQAMRLPSPMVIDMCCGAGNLACAIAHAVPQAQVWASDLTAGCVTVAQANVHGLGLQARVQVRQGDLFAGLRDMGLEGRIDAVVCNPPYISVKRLEGDRATLLQHEPREAFDGGPYGLSIHQRVIRDAVDFLRPGGVLLFEIGAGQDRQIKVLFERSRAYEGLQSLADASGSIRVALARRKVS